MAVDTNLPAKAEKPQEVAIFAAPRLPWHDAFEAKYGDIGVTKDGWKALIDGCFPLAKTIDSIQLALSYCKKRNLDPFKRVVNIVPMWSSAVGGYIDTVWPSIAELRTTAHRTGDYAGIDRPVFGPMITKEFKGRLKDNGAWKDVAKTVTFPEFVERTVWRFTQGQRFGYTAVVYWEEAYATIGKSDLPNEMWESRARGQADKCAEAAALRMAFPEEIGGQYSAEEMEGRQFNVHEMRDVTPKNDVPPPPPPPPARKAADASGPTAGGPLQLEPAKETAKPAKEPTPKKDKEQAKQADKPAKEPDTEPAVDPNAFNVTDYDAYVEEFETKVAECQGEVEELEKVWEDHTLYMDSLPILYRGKCRETFIEAGGEPT